MRQGMPESLHPGIVAPNADNTQATIKSLLGLLRRVDPMEHEDRRSEFAAISSYGATADRFEAFLERLEERVRAVLPPGFELSYQRDPTTRKACYILRRSGHEHVEDEEYDIIDTFEARSGHDPVQDVPNVFEGRRSFEVPREAPTMATSIPRVAAAAQTRYDNHDALAWGGHRLSDGTCVRCGCSAPAIAHFGWSCSQAEERPTQLSVPPPAPSRADFEVQWAVLELTAEVARLRAICQRIVDRYAATSPDQAIYLAWQMQRDAQEGLSPPS